MTLDNSADQLLSRRQAAAFLGISPDTLAAWKHKKKYDLPVVRMGILAKYKMSDLRRFIENRTEQGNA